MFIYICSVHWRGCMNNQKIFRGLKKRAWNLCFVPTFPILIWIIIFLPYAIATKLSAKQTICQQCSYAFCLLLKGQTTVRVVVVDQSDDHLFWLHQIGQLDTLKQNGSKRQCQKIMQSKIIATPSCVIESRVLYVCNTQVELLSMKWRRKRTCF